jgi:RNA polymerase sigma-70 factor (ECF subfamily)
MAEDAVQEIFIKIWVNKEKLSEIENFRAYLHILVRNHALNSLRKLANEEQFIRKLMASENHSDIETSDQAIYNELKKHLNEAVVTLSPQQKKAYNLSRIEGLKYEEIAEQMEISRETVKKHISEALRIIRKHLSEEELPLVFLVLSACTTVTKYL